MIDHETEKDPSSFWRLSSEFTDHISCDIRHNCAAWIAEQGDQHREDPDFAGAEN